MKMTEYKRTPLWKLKGRKARVTRMLQNSYGALHPGAVVTITGKQSGFEIRAEPCDECKVGLVMSRVSPYDIELLPREDCKQEELV